MEGGWVQMLLGALLSLLLAMVSAIHIACSFTSNLNRLQSTLSSVNDAVDDIETLNINSNRPRHVTEPFDAQVAEAEQLVRRCSAVSKWNVVMRLYYSHKVRSLETTLSRNFQNNAAVLLLREAAVRRELQETSSDVGVGAEAEAEAEEGDEGNRYADTLQENTDLATGASDDETQHNLASEIEILASDDN